MRSENTAKEAGDIHTNAIGIISRRFDEALRCAAPCSVLKYAFSGVRGSRAKFRRTLPGYLNEARN